MNREVPLPRSVSGGAAARGAVLGRASADAEAGPAEVGRAGVGRVLEQLLGGEIAALCRAIGDAPDSGRTVAVRGAGGFGKSTVLSCIAQAYTAAGVAVRDVGHPVEQWRDAAVLVDDAHRLDEDALRHLRERAREAGARVVLTYRPHPRPPELDALLAEVRTALTLPGWGAAELAACAGREAAGPADDERLRWAVEHSGGVPRLAVRLFQAAGRGVVAGGAVPDAVLERFHPELDRLGPVGRDLLVALSLGASSGAAPLARLLTTDESTADESLAHVRASGLLTAGDAPVPVVRCAVTRILPREAWLWIARRLIEQRLDGEAALLPVMRVVAEHHGTAPDASLARGFARAATEALISGASTLAGQLCDAAAHCGAAESETAALRVRAAGAAGDFDTALRHAERVLADEAAAGRADAARIAATALAHRGLLDRCAEMCAWSVRGPRWPGDWAFAAVALLGTGERERARGMWEPAGGDGPPSLRAGVFEQLAAGVWESAAGSAAAAVSATARAASLADADVPDTLPDSPSGIAALVALHAGEPDVAHGVLQRGGEITGRDDPLWTRMRLLSTFLVLSRGDTAMVHSELDVLERGFLRGRDRLWSAALRAGAAGRDNDTTALGSVRGALRQAVAEHPVDLFSLVPLGEAIVAAARLGDRTWIAPYQQEALRLLQRLDDPPLWSAPLRWKCLQAAIVVREHDEAWQHAAALRAASGHNPLATAMAAGAEVWLRALEGEVAAEEARQAAMSLHAAGFAWEGARLAGQVALHTADRRDMLQLLETARTLQGKPPRPRAVTGPAASEEHVLSAREREVADLVLAGRTYKEIGTRLFISAKTVEHHVGRMKQRLGCSSRQELLDRLRELLS
ncbi:helix-turn-helix transcriptional regulator [Salinifilum ghardaiensis]